jgi:beta-lactamase superfamily II metal-dependent hydrolase
MAASFKVHLLDVGPEEYGDAVLLELGNVTILIDGAHPADHTGREGHPSIPDQLDDLLGGARPHKVSLLIATHAHLDHIGCLPRIIKDKVISPVWALVADPGLGWGRTATDRPDGGVTDERVRQLVAAVREEVRTPRTDAATLQQFLLDAATLEQTYKTMIATLAERGTKVVRYGRDDPAALVTAFKNVGLKIVGPSDDHLLECAQIIRDRTTDAIDRITDMIQQDAALDPVDAYRRLVQQDFDALDGQRPGAAVNLQSVVTRFKVGAHKILFAGDMQFEKPQVNNDTIESSVADLRRAISDDGPYSFVKLSHHGSDNAFSEAILQELGATSLYGICAGEHSAKHPNPAVLKVLNNHRNDITWARTDRNGRVTITFANGAPTVALTSGNVNDPRPNTVDVTAPVQPAASGAASGAAGGAVVTAVQPGASNVVEVTARIPHVTTRVTITVQVEPAARAEAPRSQPRAASDRFTFAGGRQLPQLLFVTSAPALARNIGQTETDAVLSAIRASGAVLYDALPDGLAESAPAAALVRQQLRQYRDVKGVVLLGGHDIVPSQILDSLPPEIRRALPGSDDPDEFVVWSDDIYGDREGDDLPEVPVSRIPDGRSADLVSAALQAGLRPLEDRSGIRNIARPFAERIFDGLSGRGQLLVSQPTTFSSPPYDLDTDRVYFMLHGDYVDGTRFWGEGLDDNVEAVNLSNVPDAQGQVVFAGCCWGAMFTDTPASSVVRNRPFGQRTPDSSIALSFLKRGARAFVGCTGAHYSPVEEPYRYFGGPMHEAFWRRIHAGTPPAQALFDAKIEYFRAIPHGQRSMLSRAIEYKIWRQYTCLGLGW